MFSESTLQNSVLFSNLSCVGGTGNLPANEGNLPEQSTFLILHFSFVGEPFSWLPPLLGSL
jgi:hypothetical protein